MSDLSDLARKRVAVAAYYFVPGLVFASWAAFCSPSLWDNC